LSLGFGAIRTFYRRSIRLPFQLFLIQLHFLKLLFNQTLGKLFVGLTSFPGSDPSSCLFNWLQSLPDPAATTQLLLSPIRK